MAEGVKIGSGVAGDAFQNLEARLGYGAPNIMEATEWPLSRFSFDYWTLISIYEDDWICRRIVDVPAEDMVRAWPAILGEISVEDIQRVERAIQRTQTRQNLLTGIKWGRLFGGAGSLIVIDGHEHKLDEPLDPEDVMPGSYRGLIPFDMWSGIQPDASSVCYDINHPIDANKPEYYNVHMVGGETLRVHASRILRHVGYENPTPERETYQWFGISVLQPVIQEIQKRHNVSWNIASMTFRANILSLKDSNLSQLMSGLGSNVQATQKWQQIMSEMNRMVSNQSLLVSGESGGLDSVQYSFAGMSDIYVMFQLDIAGAAEIPFTRLWGRTVTGLGQLNESDERIYEERIRKDQETHLRPILEHKLFPVILMSELGEIPKGFALQFPSIRVLSEQEKVEQAQAIAETCAQAYSQGIISPYTYARELQQASARTQIFTNLKQEEIEQLPRTPMVVLQEKALEQAVPEVEPAPKEESAMAADAEPRSKAVALKVGPLDVVIETPKGEVRRGPNWEATMAADYGYIYGYPGADGDDIDCYVGPDVHSNAVYVVDQLRLDKRHKFDEHKVMLGFRTRNEALDAYMASHHASGKVFGAITPMTMDGFLSWLRTADLREPCNSRVGRRRWF